MASGLTADPYIRSAEARSGLRNDIHEKSSSMPTKMSDLSYVQECMVNKKG